MKKIKNKIVTRAMTAVTIVAAFLFGMAPITAFAGGCECTCEHKCTEDCIDQDCDLCRMDYTLCCGDEDSEAVEPEEEQEEPEEVTPTPEPMGPLTPDGNLTLVDDYGSPEKSGKQFITVVTKAGNYFYIIIDRDDNGEETVHFLNMVDEADLLSLMDEEAVDQYLASKGTKETPTETVTPAPTEEPEDTEPVEEPEPEKKSSSAGLIIFLLLGVAGAGVYFYFTKIKGKKPDANTIDPDADYDEDEEDYLASLPDEVAEILESEEMNSDAEEDEAEEDTDVGEEE